MDNSSLLQEAGQHFAGLDRNRTHQNRSALSVQFTDFTNNRIELLSSCFVDRVICILTDIRTISGDGQDPKLINIMKLLSLGLGRSGHPGQFGIETEIVLNGDCGESLSLSLDLDPFLCFNRLVESFAPTATRHQTAGMFIDDDDFIILNDILNVAFVEAVGLKKLSNGVDDAGFFFEFRL